MARILALKPGTANHGRGPCRMFRRPIVWRGRLRRGFYRPRIGRGNKARSCAESHGPVPNMAWCRLLVVHPAELQQLDLGDEFSRGNSLATLRELQIVAGL